MWTIHTLDDSHEMSFFIFPEKMQLEELSSAAVVISSLRIKLNPCVLNFLGQGLKLGLGRHTV